MGAPSWGAQSLPWASNPRAGFPASTGVGARCFCLARSCTPPGICIDQEQQPQFRHTRGRARRGSLTLTLAHAPPPPCVWEVSQDRQHSSPQASCRASAPVSVGSWGSAAHGAPHHLPVSWQVRANPPTFSSGQSLPGLWPPQGPRQGSSAGVLPRAGVSVPGPSEADSMDGSSYTVGPRMLQSQEAEGGHTATLHERTPPSPAVTPGNAVTAMIPLPR